MKFHPQELDGVWIIELEKKSDERGYFARTWCRDEFAAHGLKTNFSQHSLAYNETISTLRGMHYQKPPHAEVKLVCCVQGAIYDVIIDLRPKSPTFGKWKSFRLGEDKLQILYIPEGFAHGYQTLTDRTLLHYQMTEAYHPESAMGIRWDDPLFKIKWPDAQHRILSDRDLTWPEFIPSEVRDYASLS